MESASNGNGDGNDNSGERRFPVRRSPSQIVDEEFDSIRAKFELEMRRMDEEMARFRSKLVALSTLSESCKSTSLMRTTTRSSESSKLDQIQRQIGLDSAPATRAKCKQTEIAADADWLAEELGANSPLLVSDANSDKVLLRLRFDLAGYEPEQVLVKTLDNKLEVSARRETRNQNGTATSECRREFLLPPETDLDAMESSLSADGVLTVEAPIRRANSLAPQSTWT